MKLRQLIAIFFCAFCCAAVAACANSDFDPGSAGVDGDEDGYGDEIDCDDKNPSINPGMTEKVNCIDDNCDGEIDEGTPNHDRDHDGYCESTGDVGTCEGNPQRNPAAAEDGGDGSQEPNGIDDNCNGLVDDGLPTSDIDKDGFTLKDGDCNDADAMINPGAIEVAGMSCRTNDDCPSGKCYDNYCRCLGDDDCSSLDACINDTQCKNDEKCVNGACRGTWVCLKAQDGMPHPELKVCRDNTDNDCDGDSDELPEACDDPAKLDKSDPLDYAKAMELCDTDATCDLDKKCPGELACVKGKCRRVLLAEFNSNGSAQARTIAAKFAKDGPLTPRMNASMAILATGLAEYDPTVTCPQSGTDFMIRGDVDPDPQASDKEANDLAQLKLEILVPTNARSFSFDFHFLTTEYPDYLFTEFNDTFWVQLNSKKFTGNISFDKNGTPIRLNNAFFDICDPDPMKPETAKMCTQPASVLTGTGYAKICSGGTGCGGIACGGSTGWLTTTSPVEPGEKITLTFSIFDKGDGILDSAVLIDNFRWSLAPAAKPITGPD